MDVSLIASVGIDLGKTTFHLVALDCHAKLILRKKFSRTQLLAYTANLPWSIIGMEACSGAHFFAAKLRNQGHEVKLIPGQFVKPFVKANKNDFNDAEAIAEAVTRQNMRFVPIKTDDQLDLQALHRVRDRLVHRRTALINQIRGFLLERGIAFPKGPANLRNHMPAILEDSEQTSRHGCVGFWPISGRNGSNSRPTSPRSAKRLNTYRRKTKRAGACVRSPELDP